MKAVKNLIEAFSADAHAQALKNLTDVNGDGKVDLKDVAAEYAKVKAQLQARQASYWHALGWGIANFASGVYAGAHFFR